MKSPKFSSKKLLKSPKYPKKFFFQKLATLNIDFVSSFKKSLMNTSKIYLERAEKTYCMLRR